MDLQPERRFGRAARDHDASGPEGRTEIFHDQFGAEADALDDGAIDMGGRVFQRQAGDGAARQGVGVRRAVALEMIQHQQPFAAGLDLAGLLVQCVETSVGCKVALEPRDDRAGRGLAALDHRLVRIDRIHVGAPDAWPMDRIGSDSEMEVRGAGDEGHLARLRHAEADHADESVGAALHHRDAGHETEMVGGRSREGIDHVARPHDQRRPFRFEIGKPERLEQRQRQPAFAALVVPTHCHVVERGQPAAGEPPVDIVLVFADARGFAEQLRLVALHPQRFRDHPLGGDRPRAIAVDAQGWIGARRDIGGFCRGAYVHPDHGGAQRRALFINRNHRAAGGVDAEREHLVGGDASGLDRAAHRFAEAAPPILRILLGPARLRELRLIGAGVRAPGPPVRIEQDRPDALRPAIDAEQIRHASPESFRMH